MGFNRRKMEDQRRQLAPLARRASSPVSNVRFTQKRTSVERVGMSALY
jgi:hypothetical protein